MAAIQNDRDRIGPTKKSKPCTSSDEDRNTPQALFTPQSPLEQVISPFPGSMCSVSNADLSLHIQELIMGLGNTESICNEMRLRVIPDVTSAENALTSPCILYENRLYQPDYSERDSTKRVARSSFYPASMNDVKKWNIKEMRICIEWAKTFDIYQKLSKYDQFALVRNFAFAFNVLNRVYYSPDYGPDKIVYLDGALILRYTQNEVKLSGCRLIYTRQMDEIMLPLRRLRVTIPEFALFKAALFFNPEAVELSGEAKLDVYEERNKYLSALFMFIVSKIGVEDGVQKYGALLMMSASIQNIISQNEENMQVMELFKNWDMDPFVKELCLKNV